MNCVKCGNKSEVLRYHNNQYGRNTCFDFVISGKQEHLHYYCQSCNYDWTGPTKEQELNANSLKKAQDNIENQNIS